MMTTEITSNANPTENSQNAYERYKDEEQQYIPRTTSYDNSSLLNGSPPQQGKSEVAVIDDSDDDDGDDDDSDNDNHQHNNNNHNHLKKSSQIHHTLLSTQSPLGIAAASQITPNRLAKLLIETGPLPIRHITRHLSQQIPDFALLSLSKQRRLIMAALEMGDEETGCVFEKVGWGQWATKKIGADDVINYNNSKPQQQQQQQQSLSTSPPTIRRQSITNPHNDPHNLKVPYNPPSLDEAVIESSSSMNSSSDDEDSDHDNININEGEEDDQLFRLENGAANQSNTEVRFSSRVLNSLPQQQQQRRSLSSSQQRRGSSSHGIRKPKQQQTKSRLNSFDYYEAKFDNNSIEGVLDLALVPDSIMKRKKPRSSFSESYMRSTPTPSLKISSDEHLPLSSSSPPITENQEQEKLQPDTDEEDWRSIGADKLSAAYTLLMIKKED